MKPRHSFFLSLITCSLLSIPMAGAALVAYDGFASYSNGALNGNDGGTGWATSWSVATGTVDVAANGLSYNSGSLSIGGNSQAASILDATNGSPVLTRQFTNITSSEVWFSLLVQPNGNSSDDFIQIFVGTNATINNSGAVGDLSTSAGNNSWGTRIRTTADVGSDISSTGLVNGTTALLVGRISTDGTNSVTAGYDLIELWVNPTSTTLGTPTSSVDGSMSLSTTTGIDWFGIRTVGFDVGDNFVFDEFRVGTDLASVVVPEPSALSLTMALAGVMAFRRRR